MTDQIAGDYSGTIANLGAIPNDPDATIAFCHEYIHYLQALGSVAGARLLAELTRLTVNGVLIILGDLPPNSDTGIVYQYRPIIGTLRTQADGAGTMVGIPLQSVLDEGQAVLIPQDLPYHGSRAPWELERVTVQYGSFQREFDGFVTPRRTVRPFNVGFLAENMARRIDRWIARNHGFSHSWTSPVERDLYNGLYELVLQPRYRNHVTDRTAEELTVILASLALATPAPDHSLQLMLNRLAQASTLGDLSTAVAGELAALLRREGQLSATPFNEVINTIQHDSPGRCMDRAEYGGVHGQLCSLRNVATAVLTWPHFFANRDMDWSTILGWMGRFGVPPVSAEDGDVPRVGGVATTDAVSSLMTQAMRVFLP